MVIAEITIAVLLGVLLVIGGIYVTYFSITNYKLKVNRLENGDYYPEEKTAKEKRERRSRESEKSQNTKIIFKERSKC